MCLDARAMRSLNAWKGWQTRRGIDWRKALSDSTGGRHSVLDPPIKGGVRSPSFPPH